MLGLEKQLTMERVAQDGKALQYAAAELKGDREIVLAAVARTGSALKYAAAELRSHRALGWIRTTNVALHCAKLRLALATCAISTPLICAGVSLSALPRDLMELIGKCILPDATMCVVARKYGYWCDGDTPTRGKEDPGRKKRKRFHGDDVVE